MTLNYSAVQLLINIVYQSLTMLTMTILTFENHASFASNFKPVQSALCG